MTMPTTATARPRSARTCTRSRPTYDWPTPSRCRRGDLWVIHNGIRFTAMPAWGEGDPGQDMGSWKPVHTIFAISHN